MVKENKQAKDRESTEKKDIRGSKRDYFRRRL